MRRLSFAIVVLLAVISVKGQSPHGESLKIDCATCHNPSGWEIDYGSMAFDHSTTGFDLEGTHSTTDCASCHTTMEPLAGSLLRPQMLGGLRFGYLELPAGESLRSRVATVTKNVAEKSGQ